MYSSELMDDLLELGIEADSNNPKKTRDEILNRLARIHPDKTGGHFANTRQQNDFTRLIKVLETLDKETSSSSQLVPLQHVSSLIELLEKQHLLDRAPIPPEHGLLTAAETYRRYVKRKYALPKITSATVASICLVLISFLGNFKNHPLYKTVINYYTSDYQYKAAALLDHDFGEVFDRWRVISLRASVFPELIGGRQSIFSNSPLEINSLKRKAADTETYRLRFDPFSAVDPVGLSRLDQSITQLNEKLAIVQSKEERELITRINEAAQDNEMQAIFAHLKERREVDSYLTELLTEAKQGKLSEWKVKQFVANLHIDATSLANSVKELKQAAAESKAEIMDRGDGLILRDLGIIIMVALSLFAVIWTKERSDESWVDFLSSEEGLEAVVGRIHDDKRIMSRVPPRFTLLEFIKTISVKDTPRLLSPFLGGRLNMKHLSQISSLLLEKLEIRRVISKCPPSSAQSWYEFNSNNEEVTMNTQMPRDLS